MSSPYTSRPTSSATAPFYTSPARQNHVTPSSYKYRTWSKGGGGSLGGRGTSTESLVQLQNDIDSFISQTEKNVRFHELATSTACKYGTNLEFNYLLLLTK